MGKVYEVLYRNDIAFSITDGGDVSVKNPNIIPMDIYVEESDDIDDRVNNLVNFKTWCSERIIPVDRKYATELLAYYNFDNARTFQERAQIGIGTRALSLNDCFWVREKGDQIEWKDANLFKNSLNGAVFEVPLIGKGFTINRDSISPDINTDGKAAKAWLRDGKDFYLLKADNEHNSVTREVEASSIARQLFGDAVVLYERDMVSGKEVSKCKCFTNETLNMVKADYYSIYQMNHDNNFGIDLETIYKKQLNQMIVTDCLVGNVDRHARNWGVTYTYQLDQLKPIALSPVFDFDHAFEASDGAICQPYMLIGRQMRLFDACKDILKKDDDLMQCVKALDLCDYQYGEYVQERINSLEKEIALEKDLFPVNDYPNERNDPSDAMDNFDIGDNR